MPDRPGAGEFLGPERLEHGLTHVGGRDRHPHAGFLEGADLGIGRVFGAADDGTGVAHAAPGGRGAPGDERGHGLLDVLADVAGGLDLVGAADLADHQDAVGLRVVLEEAEAVDVREAADRVAADTDAGGLGEAELAGLPDGLVGEGAGAADYSNGLAPLGLADVGVDVAGHDADLAPGGGVGVVGRFAAPGFRPGRDDAGAVGADEGDVRPVAAAPVSLVDHRADADHVLDRDSLGDGADDLDPGVRGLEDRVGGKAGGD